MQTLTVKASELRAGDVYHSSVGTAYHVCRDPEPDATDPAVLWITVCASELGRDTLDVVADESFTVYR